MKQNVREWIILLSGVLTLIAGIVLVYVGLCAPPMGEIDGSVLAALGEFLTFAGACMGIASYAVVAMHKIDKKIEEKTTDK